MKSEKVLKILKETDKKVILFTNNLGYYGDIELYNIVYVLNNQYTTIFTKDELIKVLNEIKEIKEISKESKIIIDDINNYINENDEDGTQLISFLNEMKSNGYDVEYF